MNDRRQCVAVAQERDGGSLNWSSSSSYGQNWTGSREN